MPASLPRLPVRMVVDDNEFDPRRVDGPEIHAPQRDQQMLEHVGAVARADANGTFHDGSSSSISGAKMKMRWVQPKFGLFRQEMTLFPAKAKARRSRQLPLG